MAQSRKQLFIRADANSQMGTGHLMRCLALAQGWQDQGGSATFVTACDNDSLLKRFREEGFQVKKLKSSYPDPGDWQEFSQILTNHSACWVVLDGYHFDHKYHLRIRNLGLNLLVIDDLGLQDFRHADIVLNQNLGAKQLHYASATHPVLLLGERFVLLRRDFRSLVNWQREISNISKKILITMGGSDPNNLTLNVMKSLEYLDDKDFEVKVIVGASNLFLDQIRSEALSSSIEFQIIQNVKDMPGLMIWADLAITAGGITCYESAFMGLPSIIFILAENQTQTSTYLEELQAAINLGWYQDLSQSDIQNTYKRIFYDRDIRRQISDKARKIVDGNGVQRVIDVMDNFRKLNGYKYRLVSWGDKDLLWKWANDPIVRKNSLNSERIPMQDHEKWLRRKLESTGTYFCIIEQDRTPVAQIRYDSITDNMAEINFSVAEEYRRMGLGTLSIDLTMEEACKHLRVNIIQGIVLVENVASQRVFEKLGFHLTGQETINGKACIIFRYDC